MNRLGRLSLICALAVGASGCTNDSDATSDESAEIGAAPSSSTGEGAAAVPETDAAETDVGDSGVGDADSGDLVAYCSLAATLVAGADVPDTLIEMFAVSPIEIREPTRSASEGDRDDAARAIESYVLDECGVVLIIR